MNGSAQRIYDFGPFRVEMANHRLLRGGQPVPLKPKAFDLLVLLVENNGRVVAKDELMAHLWPDTIVEEASLTQNVYEIRKALGDDAHRYIENVPKRGYRFVAEVTQPGVGVETKPSVAVLPFRALGRSSRSEHLELGIADSITAALTSLRRLAVRPTSATSRYDDARRDAIAAGRELNVAFIVDGSVQVVSDTIRVTAQLLEVASTSAVWAERFDGRISDVFTLQDAIAAKIAAAIGPELRLGEDPASTRRYTSSIEAYQLYLKGRYNWNKATPEALWNAIHFFRAALEADPRYALAHVGIADAYTSLDWYGVLSTREANPHAMAAAERALEIDDSFAEAHASLAMARQYAWDWNGAESEYRIAIALNPDYAQAHQWYAIFLAFMGRFDEALSEIRRAEALDPVSLSIASQVALVLLCARRYEEATEQLRRTLQLEPESVEARFYSAMVHELQGELAEAIALYRSLPQENPDFRAMLAHALGMAGDLAVGRSIVSDLPAENSERHVSLFWIAVAQTGLGDYDAALDSLERACDNPDDSLLGVKVFPMLDPIRSDQRFVRILERMRLTGGGGGVRRD